MIGNELYKLFKWIATVNCRMSALVYLSCILHNHQIVFSLAAVVFNSHRYWQQTAAVARLNYFCNWSNCQWNFITQEGFWECLVLWINVSDRHTDCTCMFYIFVSEKLIFGDCELPFYCMKWWGQLSVPVMGTFKG